MFPVEQEGYEATPVAVGVEREVLINQIDSVAELGELAGELFERFQTAYAQPRRAVEEYIVCDHLIPLREFRSLESLIELAYQRLARHPRLLCWSICALLGARDHAGIAREG